MAIRSYRPTFTFISTTCFPLHLVSEVGPNQCHRVQHGWQSSSGMLCEIYIDTISCFITELEMGGLRTYLKL